MQYEIIQNLIGKKLVKYKCGRCGEGLRNLLNQAGQVDTCPSCKQQFKVPGEIEKAEMERQARETELQKNIQKEDRLALKEKANQERLTEQKIPPTVGYSPYYQNNMQPSQPVAMQVNQFDILSYAIKSSRYAIAMWLILNTIACGLLFLVGACGLVYQLIIEGDTVGRLMYLSFIFSSFFSCIIGFILAGFVGVIFKIEENTRKH